MKYMYKQNFVRGHYYELTAQIHDKLICTNKSDDIT